MTSDGSPVNATQCEVPLVPVIELPYDELVPYSTTDVPLIDVVHIILTEVEETWTAVTLDIAMAGVSKVISSL